MMVKRQQDFSLIPYQDQVVQELVRIEQQGVGGHKRRSRGALSGRFWKTLGDNGFAEEVIRDLWKQCKDMAELALTAEEEE
jgi:hypothetical protein